MTNEIQGECTNLTFNIISPREYDNLIRILYALDGPCKDADLSRKVVKIDFLPCSCPIGFQMSGKAKINCTCDCHSDISQYTENCDSLTESFIKSLNPKPGFPTLIQLTQLAIAIKQTELCLVVNYRTYRINSKTDYVPMVVHVPIHINCNRPTHQS